MPAPDRQEVPSAVYVDCPTEGEETLHTVLSGKVGKRGGFTLEATVQCTECGATHHVVIREAKDRDVPVIVSSGQSSRRLSITLPADEEIQVDDLQIVDGANVMVTSLETTDGKRPKRAKAEILQTIWARDYENIIVKFTINMGHKTISKHVPAKPDDLFHVGDEHTFGRLRVTVHSIKVPTKTLREGAAEAAQISRVFAKPTRPDEKVIRPPKDVRDRARVDRARAARESGKPARGARFGARKARQSRDRESRSRDFGGGKS